jgi:hypothetical protein
MAVQSDHVPRGHDLSGQPRPALDLLADDEEHAARARARKHLEHGGRTLGMGPVVEGERDATGAWERTRKLQLGGCTRQHRREGVANHAGMIADLRGACPGRTSNRPVKPDLDHWLADPAIRVAHRRESSAPAPRLWEAARSVRLADTSLLGRLVRLRIPGVPPDVSFDEMFRRPPFVVLEADPDGSLVSGLVGRIWTLRRDYPELDDPEDFRRWSTGGTARVLFANWVEPAGAGRTALRSETRVEALGAQGRLGVAAVRPLVAAFQQLIGSEGIEAGVRLAERR